MAARARSDTAKPSFASIEDFVRESEGRRAIKRVFVANNGIAAVKLMRSVRTFSYETFGDDRAVREARGPTEPGCDPSTALLLPLALRSTLPS